MDATDIPDEAREYAMCSHAIAFLDANLHKSDLALMGAARRLGRQGSEVLQRQMDDCLVYVGKLLLDEMVCGELHEHQVRRREVARRFIHQAKRVQEEIKERQNE